MFYVNAIKIINLNLISYRTKESYWQKILTFCQSHKALTIEDHSNTKQLLYCLTIFFLHCLYDYNLSLTPEACPGQIQTNLVLIEAFTGM